MSSYGPYGITCQCYNSRQRDNLKEDELDQLYSIATNMIIRTQWYVDFIAPKGPEPVSTFDFSALDKVVRAINSHPGLICLLGFQAPSNVSSPWLKGSCADGCQPGVPIMRPEEWATFAQHVVNHYQRNAEGLHIEIIECGNEDYNQDAGPDTPTCNAPDVAAATVTAIYQAVKTIDPTILVGCPATKNSGNCITPYSGICNYNNVCTWWQRFFQPPFGAIPPQPILADYMNFHSYTAGVKCCGRGQDCFTLLQEAQHIRKMNQLYQPNKIIPIWCTEIGFKLGGNTCEKTTPAPPHIFPAGNITEAVQAQLLMETMEAARRSGGTAVGSVATAPPLIEVICWYTMDYTSPIWSLATGPSHQTYPKNLRPAYYAYKWYVEHHPHWP